METTRAGPWRPLADARQSSISPTNITVVWSSIHFLFWTLSALFCWWICLCVTQRFPVVICLVILQLTFHWKLPERSIWSEHLVSLKKNQYLANNWQIVSLCMCGDLFVWIRLCTSVVALIYFLTPQIVQSVLRNGKIVYRCHYNITLCRDSNLLN